MFGKYGRFMRGGPTRGTFYDDVLHIPLIIKLPGIVPARRSALISHIDVLPTIMDFLGITTKGSFEGKSARPIIENNTETNSMIFAGSKYSPGEDNYWFNKWSFTNVIRTKEWKLIQEIMPDQMNKKNTLTEELYHINVDKYETKNLVKNSPQVLQQLRQKLNDWTKRMQIK
jgi:arylsulfatase A-like enzyme